MTLLLHTIKMNVFVLLPNFPPKIRLRDKPKKITLQQFSNITSVYTLYMYFSIFRISFLNFFYSWNFSSPIIFISFHCVILFPVLPPHFGHFPLPLYLSFCVMFFSWVDLYLFYVDSVAVQKSTKDVDSSRKVDATTTTKTESEFISDKFKATSEVQDVRRVTSTAATGETRKPQLSRVPPLTEIAHRENLCDDDWRHSIIYFLLFFRLSVSLI